MNIIIKTVDESEQRYDTAGDWQVQGNDLYITVSKQESWKEEVLIGVHELIEAILCKNRGITDEEVTEFDKHFKKEGEPGDAPDAPYRKEHHFATIVEMLLCKELEMDWGIYNNGLIKNVQEGVPVILKQNGM